MTLGKDDVLVIEGIHGLNDKLSYSLPIESKFKIYISALTLSLIHISPLILEAATAMLVALEALGSNFVVQEPRTIAACAPSPAEISVVAFLPSAAPFAA